MKSDDEENQLRSAALQNVQSILAARLRAEQELRETKEALEEETRILELLNENGVLLASKLDLQSVVQAVTDAGTALSGAQFGAFFHTQRTGDQDVFTLYTLTGAPRVAFEQLGMPRATPLFAPTFGGRGPIRIGDVRTDPRYGQMDPHHGMPPGHLPVRSYLAVPVVARSGDVIGGLFFGHSEPHVFSERSERLILGLAGQAAISIDNARLYEAARRSAEERAVLLEAERAARAEIERVSLMKDEFVLTLSHELRTPLNAVLGWSEVLLAQTLPADSKMRAGLEAIVRNGRAQAQLIEDLLDMNSIVSGKIRLDVQRVELAPIIDGALESVRPSADAKSIAIRKTIDPTAGAVVGDPNRLQQIVWNLLTNAVKFTPKGGSVQVLLQRVRSHVEITVADTGIGVDADFLPHLFERFRQADSSTTRHFGGLGLGLSIVKQLVELHGGTIRAHSEGAGRGATFIIELPIRAEHRRTDAEGDHPSDDPTSAAAAPVVSLTSIRVLIVDDERDAREMLDVVLTGAAADVLAADSATVACELVRNFRPHVIISDIGMPERDGYRFIREVRSLPAAEGGRTPAIALTAYARSEDRTRAMLAGYQVHVTKPFDARELVATVKSLAGTTPQTGDDGF